MNSAAKISYTDGRKNCTEQRQREGMHLTEAKGKKDCHNVKRSLGYPSKTPSKQGPLHPPIPLLLLRRAPREHQDQQALF